jgi:NAD(P)-dependent dehydrogenase (short-subunit alcohol dehydrogenase family)
MSITLNDKVIVVTGGAGLIGRAFCNAVCEAGGTVVVAEINEVQGKKISEELAAKYNGRAFFSTVDITSEDSVRALIAAVDKKYGRIDGLVNNAYPRNKNYGARFEDVAYRDFVENVGMHVGGYFLISQQFLAYFEKQKKGNIVNMGSIYGVMGPRFQIYEGTAMTMAVEYAVIKAGIINLTRYIARYYQRLNIRCNAISPGGVFNNQDPAFVARYNSFGTNKGMIDAADLCGTLVYLLSDASSCVNGQNIMVDDGWSL